MAATPRMVARAGLLWRTARRLRLHQVTNRIWRTVWNPPLTRRAPLLPRAPQRPWRATPAHPAEWLDRQSVEILHVVASVRERGDWQRAFSDDLRLYHLHYLEQLTARAHPVEDFPLALLERWLADNPPGSAPGWHPYPLSRRLVNAIEMALSGTALPIEVAASLADQCRYLRPRLEFHLLGNHLLANAKALMFGGAYFQGAESDRWLRQAQRLVLEQVQEQILPDGGHIERSPMYHALVTQDLLDLVNLRNTYALPGLAQLDETCLRMLSWYATMSHPDGDLALLNDAALGIAPPLRALLDYADRLGLPHLPSTRREAGYVLLDASGFGRIARGSWCLLADVGGIAPAYQPGHAHAGTLTFELSLGAERVVVDTGVSTYSSGPVRSAERGTAAHNAVTLDGRDSSEVWSAFRVGDRARVTARAAGEDAARVWMRATHDGYTRSAYRASHTRCWRVSAAAIEVEDGLMGQGTPVTESSLHFHPDCRVQMSADGAARVVTASGRRLRVELDPAAGWRLEEYFYAPTFGVRQKAPVLRGVARAALPLKMKTRVQLEDSP